MGLGFGELQDTQAAAEASLRTRQVLQSHWPDFLLNCAARSTLSTGAGVDFASDCGGVAALVEPFANLHEAQVSQEESFFVEQFSHVH